MKSNDAMPEEFEAAPKGAVIHTPSNGERWKMVSRRAAYHTSGQLWPTLSGNIRFLGTHRKWQTIRRRSFR